MNRLGISFGSAALLVVLAAAVFGAPPAHVSFKHIAIDNPYPFRPHCKAAADVDGDGFADVVAASAAGAGLFWYEFPRWTKRRIDEGAFTTDVQLADVDGDGDPDVIIPKTGVGLVWYENPRARADPGAVAWPMHVIDAQLKGHHDVEVGDIDRDGRLDVVTRLGETRVYLQPTPGRWTRAMIPTGGRGGLALADLDGDGDLDLAQNGYWLECPPDPISGQWRRHDFAAGWPDDVGVTAADLNQDGRPDLLLAPAEGPGRLAWFEAPANPGTDRWREHVIDPDVSHIHTFKLADMDRDGELDLVTAEMEQSPRRRVGVYWNLGKSLAWKQQVVSTHGSHNVRVADLNGDGYLDIVGANHGNYEGRTPIDAWLNRVEPKIGLNRWTQLRVAEPGAPRGTPALGIGDVSGHARLDLVAGRQFIRNPGGDMANPWSRIALPNDPETGQPVDAQLLFTVVRKGRYPALGPMRDALASSGRNIVWLQAGDPRGDTWTARIVARLPEAAAGSGVEMKLMPGRPRPDIVLSATGGTFLLKIPDQPETASWPFMKIASADSGERQAIAVGDIDGDAHADLVLATAGQPVRIECWRNPGDGSTNWGRRTLRLALAAPARLEIADLNRDGRGDIIATGVDGATVRLRWFEAPPDPFQGEWKRHAAAQSLDAVGGLAAADINEDGWPDLVVGETEGRRRLLVFESLERARWWRPHVISAGAHTHHSVNAADLDGDGHLDLVDVGGGDASGLHVWRNHNGIRDQPAQRPAIEVWHGDGQSFGRLGNPQRWVNILGRVTHPQNLASLSHALNGGPPTLLKWGCDLRRLAREGDFNIELERSALRAGTNEVQITALNFDGRRTSRTVTVDFTTGRTWPLPYAIDWNEVRNVADVVEVVDGHWRIEREGIRTAEPYYDRVLAIGDVSWTDYEVETSIVFHQFMASVESTWEGPPYARHGAAGVLLRWQGHHDDGRQPRVKWNPTGGLGMIRGRVGAEGNTWQWHGGESSILARQSQAPPLELGRKYNLKARVETLPGPKTRYAVKSWDATAPEPAEWSLVAIDGPQDTQSGSLLFVVHHADVTLGNVRISPISHK